MTSLYEKDLSPFVTINEVYTAHIESLRERFPSCGCQQDDNVNIAVFNQYVEEDEVVLVDTVRRNGMKTVSRAFLRAGPRKQLHFDPGKVTAAVVTCGGLCPGLNNCIRETVKTLQNTYGVKAVWGVTGGWNGFSHPEEYEPVLLTDDFVENIHHEGGTVLRTSRGGFDIDKTIDFLIEKEICQLYVIGGTCVFPNE
jgi:6-phosphofructokinase 1